MTALSPSGNERVETSSLPSLPSTLTPPSSLTSSSTSITCTSLATTDIPLDPKSPLPLLLLGESVLLDGESAPTSTTCLDPLLSDEHLIHTPIAPAQTAMSSSSSKNSTFDHGSTTHSPTTRLDAISIVPKTESNDIINTTLLDINSMNTPQVAYHSNQGEEESIQSRLSEGVPTTHGLYSTAVLTAAALLGDQLSCTHSSSGQRDQDGEQASPSSLVQLLASHPIEESTTATSITAGASSETATAEDSTTAEQLTTTIATTTPRLRDIPPPLSLPPRFSSQAPMFTSADEPPPYSPTHTILPHYFELEPIPVRTYIIKDATGFPFLYDFWLISTTQSSSSRPQSVFLQERGLSPQHQAELKYSIIRPQHTDRTALPITGPGATNAYFTPALALVADNYPSRWIWWGTEALQMVVFGRQLKNIIMEWRWKHGRTRFGGPIAHRLVGCSFQIAPDRRYCWKAGSGKLRSTTAQQARSRLRQQQQRARASGVVWDNLLNASASNNDGTFSTPPTQQAGRATERGGGGSGGWFGGLFGRARRPSRSNTEPAELTTVDITLDSVHVHAPSSEAPSVIQESVEQDNPPLSAQESVIDSTIDGSTEDEDDDDDEAGCYHCREESTTAFLGRIVAVYKPGRPANRARDRAATSRKLEIFTEVGERCETAMMLMCTRLDDLFMSIPATKRGSLVTSRTERSSSTGGGRSSSSGDGTASGQQQQTATAGMDRNHHGETGGGGGAGDGVGLGNNNIDQGGGRPSSLSPSSSVSFTKRLIGTRRDWLFRIKWAVAAILTTVVLVLVLKPKHSTPSA